MTSDPSTAIAQRGRPDSETTEDSPRRCGRCDFRGSRDKLKEHAVDAGHPLCVICKFRSLHLAETAVCEKCIERTRDQLNEIVDTVLNRAARVIHFSGYYGMFGADLLVMTTDGSIEGGGPDEWITDPTPVIAVLEANMRAWRRSFGEAPSDEVVTVIGCAGYLRRNLWRAAAGFDGFDDFVFEVRTLHSRLLHTAGFADDPERAPAECFKCGGRLVRVYRPLKSDPQQRLERIKHKVNSSKTRRRRPTSAKERRAMVLAAVSGREFEGLTDKLECSNCGETYTFAQYGLALRTRADACKGWVDIKLAAEVSRVPERNIRAWIDRQKVASACRIDDHRLLVWWPELHELAVESRLRHAKKTAAA